jgi:tRNA/rRNA methyltransferase
MAADARSDAQPTIVLVGPQLGENIGATARAMANFGLADLRLVTPREGWPNEKATAAASGADHVIDRVQVYDTLSDAVADLTYIYATTARQRDLAKQVVGPREAAREARARGGAGVGILFGREKSGLANEEISLADAILTFPVDPGFASLNIAQAVLLVAYEWRLAGIADEAEGLPFAASIEPASRAELIGMFEHLERALDDAGFFRPPERKPHLSLAIRAMLSRAGLTEQEVRTLRGMIAALERRPTRPHTAPDGTVSTGRGPA